MPEEFCAEEEMTRADMLQKIRCLGFAVVELAEYLDTHADDKRALALHKEYANELRELTTEELVKKEEELREELFNLRFASATGNLEKPSRIRDLRHTVARCKTVLKERELGERM